eukprot:915938_1
MFFFNFFFYNIFYLIFFFFFIFCFFACSMAAVSRNTQIILSLSPPLMPIVTHVRSASYTLSVSEDMTLAGTDLICKPPSRTPSILQSFTADTDDETDIDVSTEEPQQHDTHSPITSLNILKTPINDDEEEEDDVFDRILFSFSRQESITRDARRSLSSRRHKKLHTARRLPILTTHDDIEDHSKRMRQRGGTTELMLPSPSTSASFFNALTKCDVTGDVIPLPTYRQRWVDDSEYDSTTPSPTGMDTLHIGDIELVGPPIAIRNTSSHDSPLIVYQEPVNNRQVSACTLSTEGRRPHVPKTPIRRNFSTPNIDEITDGLSTYINGYIDSEDEDDDVITIMGDADKTRSDNVHRFQAELVLETTAQSLMVSCGDSQDVFRVLRQVCIDLKKDKSQLYRIGFEDKILKHDHVEAFLKLLGFIKHKQDKQWICDTQHRADTRLIDCAVLECHKCLRLIHKHARIKDLVYIHRIRSGTSISSSIDNTQEMDALKPLKSLSIIQSQPSLSLAESINSMISVHEEKDKADEHDDYLQLYELIWSITHKNNEDHQAQDVLLLCYPLVTTATHIMQCLDARFFVEDDEEGIHTMSASSSAPPTPTTPPDTSATLEWIQSSFTVQAKVIEVIRRWMQRYWDKDWINNPQLISQCRQFAKRIRVAYERDSEKTGAQKGLRLVEMLHKTMLNQKKKHKLNDTNTPLTHPQKTTQKHKKARSIWSISNASHHKSANDLQITDVNHIIMAEQITLRQFMIFKSIHHRECLKQSWKDKKHKHELAPNITQYIDAFNRLTRWIQSSILGADNVKMRGRIIKKWVKIEQEIYKLRNFQTLCAIFSALASTAVYKLKDAWNYVAKKHIAQHEMIKVIMRSTANWKNLRRLQLETHPPMIPYFGMFAQDLIVIEETSNNRSNDGSINWNALWRVNAVIDKYLIYQNTSYNNLSTNAIIQTWMDQELHKSEKLDDEWVFQVSNHVNNKDKQERMSKRSSTRLLFK